MCRILVPSSILSGLKNSLASFVTSADSKSLAIKVTEEP